MNLLAVLPLLLALRRRAALALATVLLAACGSSDEPAFGMGGRDTAPPGAGDLSIKVLSNRADLISAGDALVEIVLPAGAGPDGLSADVDGRDVSGAFARRGNGRVIGLITGLALGENVLTARVPGAGGARIRLTNHPQGGPVFAGPQIQPWTCAAGAEDAQCNRAPVVTYQCMAGGRFAACDPENPPANIASTTTDHGITVPYIVRVETGAIDRDEYRIAVLYDPTKPLDPAEPQPQFNHKLVITHGASCDTEYEQGSASDVMNDTALSRGFAVMSNALNNSGHNCNIVVQAESMVMTKERVIDSLGELRYTIGSGCSGGALAQYWMANAYPGLYQGISPACSFADAWSSAIQYVDYELLRRYFEDATRWAAGVAWTPVEWIGVYGHPNPANPITFTEVIPGSGDPSRSCPGVPAEDVYDAATNPGGVRCSLHDYTVNVFGRRPEDGFAARPADNVGVQYGLKALEAGSITAAQFVDLNHKIGSWDIDYNETTQRIAADRPALEYVYRSGSVNVANNLDQVAIIDLRGPDPGAFHDAYRAYALRARLDREHGHHDNQLIWRGPVPLFGDATFANAAILALDRWLTAVELDTSSLPLPQKLLQAKPADLVERCTNGAGVDVPAATCDAVVIAYTSPRIEAGMPYTDDVVKCQLKPLDAADYPVTFTEAQWALLEETFPEGVCDYTRPGVDFVRTVPWLDYTGGAGGVPLGDAPASQAVR